MLQHATPATDRCERGLKTTLIIPIFSVPTQREPAPSLARRVRHNPIRTGEQTSIALLCPEILNQVRIGAVCADEKRADAGVQRRTRGFAPFHFHIVLDLQSWQSPNKSIKMINRGLPASSWQLTQTGPSRCARLTIAAGRWPESRQ